MCACVWTCGTNGGGGQQRVAAGKGQPCGSCTMKKFLRWGNDDEGTMNDTRTIQPQSEPRGRAGTSPAATPNGKAALQRDTMQQAGTQPDDSHTEAHQRERRTGSGQTESTRD
jgi:hypothetical protein